MNAQSGDLLLFRPAGLLGRIVAWGTGSEYCHVAVVDGGELLEYREFGGFRRISCLVAVAEWGGMPDVYRVVGLTEALFCHVVNAFHAQSDIRYGWWHAIMAGITRRLPDGLFRDCENHPPHCAEAACRAFWLGAGINLVPYKSDWRSTPGDIAKSIYCMKKGRLEI